MEELQDNLILRYIIVPLNFPTDGDGCGKKFLVPHSFSCPTGGLFRNGTMTLLRNRAPFQPRP